MAKAKNKATAVPTETLSELDLVKNELSQWETWLKSQGVTDDMEDHVYSGTVKNLKDKIAELEAK